MFACQIIIQTINAFKSRNNCPILFYKFKLIFDLIELSFHKNLIFKIFYLEKFKKNIFLFLFELIAFILLIKAKSTHCIIDNQVNNFVVFASHTQHIVLRVTAAFPDQIAARFAKCEQQIGSVRPADCPVKISFTSRLLIIKRIL